MASKKVEKRAKIKRRIRKNVFGTSTQPRLSVFRSNKEIYAQVIDDVEGKTLASSSSYKNKAANGKSKSEAAAIVGKELAESNWLNDKDDNLINFYHVLQNEKEKKALFRMLENETVSRSKYQKILSMEASNKIEKAYKYFYLNRTSFSGIMNNPRWGYLIGSSVTPEKWIDRIIPVAEKFTNAKITCLDFREVLANVKSDSLVYLDPPYFKASKGIYSKEFTMDDHYDLMEILQSSNSPNNWPQPAEQQISMIGAFGKPKRRFASKLQPSYADHDESSIRKIRFMTI